MRSGIDSQGTDDVVCPYCGYEISDSWEYPESEDEECSACSKHFHYTRHTSVTYYSERNCELNGTPHEWQDENIFSDDTHQHFSCKNCDRTKYEKK